MTDQYYFICVSAWVHRALGIIAATVYGKNLIDSIPPDQNVVRQIEAARRAITEISGSGTDTQEFRTVIAASLIR
jgi:hypothetical protein